MASRDVEWRQFSALCNDLRSVKNSKGVSSAIDKLQSFLSDDRSRQLVHRWRSWGYLLNCLLHVIKEEMRLCRYMVNKIKSRTKTSRSKMPQLRYWHYLRTELETAHVTADGPLLHLDPNGRDCICQLFAFSLAVIERQKYVGFGHNFETLVDKEAWLTVEVLVQYRVYCAVLDYNDWKNVTEVAIGSFAPNCDAESLIGDVATATTRVRVLRLLLRNCPFDLISLLPRVTFEILMWFQAVKVESNADLLLVVASTMMETLTDLMRTNFSSIAPFILKQGVIVLEFICISNKERKNGLKGAPGEFVMQFLELYQHNSVTVEPDLCYLSPKKLLRAMKKLVHVATSPEEINLIMMHFNSAKERRLGNALGIEDQEVRRLACTADIIFYHDLLVSEWMQSITDELTQDEPTLDQFDVGNKRPRFTSTELAWEVVIEHVFDSPRTDTHYMTASSASSASQRQTSSVAYLSRDVHPSQSRRTDTHQSSDSGLWLLLLLSILRRHGDYYMSNRIGDLMIVMQKLGDMLVVKEMGKWQLLTLQILIQMASLSARFHGKCTDYLREHWLTVWQNLLRPELPYARMTEGIGLMRGQAGDTVLTLLNCCIAFRLVSINIIEASSKDLWNLPAFRQPALDTQVSRGDTMRPYARTSMASISTLLSLLRHIQVPAGADTTAGALQAHGLLDTDDDIVAASHASVPSRLLQSVFDHLRAQVFCRNIAPSVGNGASSFTRVDWQTEVSPMIYASVIRSFFGHTTSKTDAPEECAFVPELLRKFSTNSEKECESWLTAEELNGFGVAFCMLENGLDSLSMAFPSFTGVKPSAFSPLIQAVAGKVAGTDESSWYEGISLCERNVDYFERLAVPAGLLGKLIPRQNVFSSNDFCVNDSYVCAQSISKKKVQALQKEVINLFAGLLAEIASNLPSDESSPMKGLRLLANSLDVGLVLATLYADEIVHAPDSPNESCIRVLPLLRQYLEIVANYLKPSAIEQAQQSQSMSENIVHILRKLHTVILISQGRNTLGRCCHPSADPIELWTPPDLRPAIHAIVSSVEASLASLSGIQTNSPSKTMVSPHDGSSSIRGLSRWASSFSQPSQSQPRSQLIQNEWDTMDDAKEDDVSRDRPASRVLQKSASLWCFRLILLLKKDSGLSSVKSFFEGILFEPDFVLAVAVLLCGVTGHDSLEVFVKLIDYAAEKGTCENCTRSSIRDESCRTSIFLSQVLSALALAGLVYEKRQYERDESPPALLLTCAKKHLETMASLQSKLSLRMARRAELQCLEVFFRLSTREFSKFETACVTGLTDWDVSVRVVASRSLQSIYYMYPAGGEKIFRHILKTLGGLLDAPAVKPSANVGDEIKAQHQPTEQEVADPRLSIDWCLPVLLSLYVSACSSQMALPAVLTTCVEMASMTASLHAVGAPSLIATWLDAMALSHGYADVSNLLDDHFCRLWYDFVTASHQPARDNEQTRLEWTKSDLLPPLPNGKYLLQQFPLEALLGKEFDLATRRSFFSTKLDMILSIGVLHCFIFGQEPSVKGNRFDFVGELISFFFASDSASETEHANVVSAIDAQLTTDLFAFSFILSAHPDPMLNGLANQIREVADERAQVCPLSLLQLGHIASKMVRFTVWGILEGNGDEKFARSEFWKSALNAMREEYVEFDWKLINLADHLSEFYVLLLRTALFYPRAVCTVECFNIFVTESCDAVVETPMLQHFMLLICFQAIKHLAIRNRRRIGSILSRLVRVTCERFLKKTDMFGKYLGFVVQEISCILLNCTKVPRRTIKNAMSLDVKPQNGLSLNVDDQAELERVIFAVCNGFSSGLGKYALDIDMVPNGISESLDKLNALIIESKMMGLSKESQGEEGCRLDSSPHCIIDPTSNQAKQHIQMFIQREHMRGTKFYNPLLFGGLSRANTIENKSSVHETAHTSTESFADVRLSEVTTSIGSVRDSSLSTKKLYGKLASTLLYLSSSSTFGNKDFNQDSGITSLANALGELGALDANDYELSLATEEGKLSRLYRLHFHRGALQETKTTFSLMMHEDVLAHLSSIVFEGRKAEKVDPSILEQALKILKNILNLDEGVRALAQCKDGELKSFLCPFEGSPPSTWSSAFPKHSEEWGQKPRNTLRRCTELWTSAEKKGFEAWVCSLTSFLAMRSPDQVLKACSALVSLRVDMAVFLFPHALESILRRFEHQKKPGDKVNTAGLTDSEDISGIAKAINEGIDFVLTGEKSYKSSMPGATSEEQIQSLQTLSTQPPEAIQLVIHSINFLREIEKTQFVETNGRGRQKLSTRIGPKRLSGQNTLVPKETYGNGLAYGCIVDVKDFLAVAKAAVRVKMPYSAMQYVEMWLEKEHGGKITSLSSLNNDEVVNVLRGILVDAYGFGSDDDGIYGVNDGRTLESQLTKFNREGQHAKALPLYDVSLQFINSNVDDGAKMAGSHSLQLMEGMLTSLQLLGYNNLLEGYLQSMQWNRQSMNLESLSSLQHKYELAWKNMQWEAILPGLSRTGNTWKYDTANGFSQQKTIFEGLRAIAHGKFTHLQNVMSKAKRQILRSIQLSLQSFESTKESYSAMVYLQAIREIEEMANHMEKADHVADKGTIPPVNRAGWSAFPFSPGNATPDPRVSSTIETLLDRWQQRRNQIKNDFDKAESLLALEEVLLQVSRVSDDKKRLTKLYLDLASLSRKAGRTAVAYRALLKLEQLDQNGLLRIHERMQWKIQTCKLLWQEQEFRSAIWTGKKACSELSTYLHDSSLSAHEATSLQLLLVQVLTITGKWIASQRSESSQTILEDYFQKATKIMTSMDADAVSERAQDAAKAHFALADFMAAMYQQVNIRVTSREWLAGKKVVHARHEELRELQSMEQTMQNENRAHIHALNREVVHDMNERSKVESSVDQFLIGALCSYGKGLCFSPQAELDMVFRMFSLWFNNQLKADINRVVIQEIIDVVPSFNFVPLSYQIISRISSSTENTSTFQTALRKLVIKLSVEHPHHTLIQLVALKNSGDVEGKGALQFRANVGDAKAEGARVYLAELMKTELRELLESIDSIANAYVQLALFDTSEYHGQKKKISFAKVSISETNLGRFGATPFDQCLRVRARRGGTVVMPAVLTAYISPRADMDYSNVVRMYSFEPQFSITDSGIHRPKIIYCYGSDGKRYKQLVKGQDDTRQDLVIEQVFETMNQFLMEEKESRKRKLRLRTYRVVPLSPIAGVLEWVENTIPWGSYLVSRTSKRLSAHERYHPFEWKHAECRQYLKNAPEKLPAFAEIQANFTPVFHHFFLEMFPDAAVWYYRRLAYVQSAAVTSIVGYILGIGDRHSQNILIHEETGELVHIDFGVVFDQGMALYTPETVPFRLTRDMVDGMGISGVDGVFSRCCEVTLQLLRKKSASVVTILEVFVHDPLYRWMLSPLKALKIQEGGENDGPKSAIRPRRLGHPNSSSTVIDSGSTNFTQPAKGIQAEPGNTDAAARALIRVKQKLEGYEDPNGSALSIEGQVKQLLSAAQDPHNLCRLFPGWAPWL
ncbi:unnamed protein product [Peronospora belbahrii]|uniref:non-specific serine/threonine protein kinase n=1 Tax=Peronospora belbahrii TaxID=622444 RepID=A0ABN8CQ14_9STRA|nr:unnamed protein product [Peronospora belbahrii]